MKEPKEVNPLEIAEIMATENCSPSECADAAECIRDLVSELTHLRGVAFWFAGYVLTAKRHNTDKWMDGLARYINMTLEALGDEDRFEYCAGELQPMGDETAK